MYVWYGMVVWYLETKALTMSEGGLKDIFDINLVYS